MTERERRYQEECAIDLLMEARESEEPFRPVMFDDLLPAAMAMLQAKENGETMIYQMMVVLYEADSMFPSDQGRWKYRAIPEERANGMHGCRHKVDAVDFRWAQALAVAEHRQTCVGRGES